MNRAHSSPTLPLMLMMAVAVWAAHAANPDTPVAAQPISGAYAVTFSIKAPSTVQSGSTVTCKARITPKLAAQTNGREATPAQTVQGVATLSGLAANCTVLVPFSFASGDPRTGAALSYEIDAVSGSTLEAVRRQDGIAVPLPQAGTTANLRLDVNF
jgi:hypothetical protein